MTSLSVRKKRKQRASHSSGRLRPGYPFTDKRRGWPSSKRLGFHAVCVRCDGYASSYALTNNGEYGVVGCPCCGDLGYSKKVYQPQSYTRRKSE